MERIDAQAVARALSRFAGQRAYLHFEFCRGGFVRNLAAHIAEVHLRGDGPYRVALRCEGDGWVIMEELTHVELSGNLLFLCALEDDQRLARALQISLEPFAP